MSQFVGLDLSLKNTAVSVVDNRGHRIWIGKSLSDPESILHTPKPWAGDIELVGLEACPLSEWIFAGLSGAGLNVRRIETRHAQRFLSTRPNKTDCNDAEGIAQTMRLGHFKPVHVKSRAAQGIQTIIAARAQVVSSMVRLGATARGLIKKFGHKVGRGGRVSLAERIRIPIANEPDLCIAIHPLLDARETLRQQKLAFDRVLYAKAKRMPETTPILGVSLTAVAPGCLPPAPILSAGLHRNRLARRSINAWRVFRSVARARMSSEILPAS